METLLRLLTFFIDHLTLFANEAYVAGSLFVLVQNEVNTLSAYGASTKKLLAVSMPVCLCGLNKAVHNAVTL